MYINDYFYGSNDIVKLGLNKKGDKYKELNTLAVETFKQYVVKDSKFYNKGQEVQQAETDYMSKTDTNKPVKYWIQKRKEARAETEVLAKYGKRAVFFIVLLI